MTIFFTIVGTLLVFAGLQDLFHTLFHPAARGDISDWMALRIWRIFRRVPQALDFAGPTAFVTIVLFWALSIVVGFALLYYPHLPQAFAFSEGLNPGNYASAWGALNISLSSLITVSSGAHAKEQWIGLLMGIEAVFGFALLTASISWILSIYPVLEHRRSLAQQATLLHFSEATGIRSLDEISDSDLERVLLGFAAQLISHRNELTQFPITYFFYERDKETALAGILPYLSDISEQSAARGGAAAIAATTLGGAIDALLKVIARSFLTREFTTMQEILAAYAEDQRRAPVRSPRTPQRAAA
jgi:hypothetical protein